MGAYDVHGREGSIELRSLQHSLRIPTDHLIGQTLQSAEFKFFRINYNGQEEEYYTIKLERVEMISVNLVMHDTRTITGTGHMEDVSLAYEKITHFYKDGNILHSDAWNEKKQA